MAHDTARATAPSVQPTFSEYFARLFEYDRWANRRVLDAMRSLGTRLPAKPLDRLSHLLVCQKMWVGRITGAGEPVTDFFPSWPLDQTEREAGEIGALMERFIAQTPEERLFAEFRYTSSEGDPYTNRIADILTQLSQHGCYHRGQIAVELNPLLAEPLATDYVFFCRKG
ncbi:MAG: hypothetical protein D6693_10590 [Planctomycetota bacterium]|nr:MAG: hypothetical protein D6693_10590 [Planctomycetota bacterium]